ncbi:MAG: hypothetical protein IKT57_01395 [Clostridia bacterium]|nr:hypothetical protein [Clostridia bacterium]
MRIHFHSLLFICTFTLAIVLILYFPCSPCSAKCEEAPLIRVIAHNDTAFMQQQKLLVRNKALILLHNGMEAEDIIKALKADGFPLQTRTCTWTPHPPLPSRQTFLIILGSGKGHNWWGVLHPDIYRSPLFQTHHKNGAAFSDADQNKIVVFPFLDSLFRFWKRLCLISAHPEPIANW